MFFLLLALVFIGFSVIDVFSNQKFTNRQKANLFFLIFLLPFVGTLIYFCIKPLFYTGSEKNRPSTKIQTAYFKRTYLTKTILTPNVNVSWQGKCLELFFKIWALFLLFLPIRSLTECLKTWVKEYPDVISRFTNKLPVAGKTLLKKL